ncbi:glycosyltransferase family 2 protein, partial [Leucobacter sp. M11]|uniref:glycosyltransferase family 2 protein n=1 Tax=Leucobacter sp. M11 TaxID=2993565 RepID=UPI002D810082
HYAFAAEWLERFAGEEALHDHVSEFFVEQVLLGLASDLRLTRLALQAAADQREAPPAERIEELLRRLLWIFRAELCVFERKRYASLSHEPNKAMNLNSFISLMGGVFRQEGTDQASTVLVRRGQHEASEPGDLVVPDSRYLLTLDADSQLLRDYCIRLVYLLEQPENERIAVTQTPYSSFRGAPTRIERIAGATTDLQYQLHQGMTHYDATFWVGANAVIRKAALNDIAETETVGGFTITTYVQDRTVIEDTESSIDLGTHGWSLKNYPERLSYSATPPDFGSLVVQRRRWANGGLLIMPKFFEQIRARRGSPDQVRASEWMLRTNYMVSITWASLGLLFLLFYPFDSRLLSPLVFVAALPYFLSMGSDLRDAGHRFSDIFRIYGFNLVLLPVNLAGVAKSVQQAITGQKIPFARTPKVASRTAAPAIYVAIPYLIVIFSVITALRDFQLQNWGNAAFAAFNAIMATWAIYSYIGLRNSLADIVLGVVGWLYVPVKPKKTPPVSPVVPKASTEVDWRGILYHGDRRLNRDLRRGGDRRRRLTPDRVGGQGPRAEATGDAAPEPTATEVIRVLFAEADTPAVEPGDSYGRPPRPRARGKRRAAEAAAEPDAD